MLKTRIIPCLDVENGRVVKGINFVNLVDAGDPVLIAKAYNEAGADELCFLDIKATAENRDTTYNLVQKTAESCFMPITVGGGVRRTSDVKNLLLAGADKVSINSAAITNPDIISSSANRFGNQCIVVAIDAKRVAEKKWEIFSHGGTKCTEIDAVQFAKHAESKGAGELLLTSMDQDGTQNGYDIDLITKVSQAVNIPIIASGGAGTLKHLVDAVKDGGASAVLAASIFHFGKYSIKETKQYMQSTGIPMRIL